MGVKAQISDAPDITQGASCINFKVKSNIFYSYEVGSVGHSPSGLTGGVALLYTYSAAKASTSDAASICTHIAFAFVQAKAIVRAALFNCM